MVMLYGPAGPASGMSWGCAESEEMSWEYCNVKESIQALGIRSSASILMGDIICQITIVIQQYNE